MIANDFSKGSVPRAILRLALPMIGAQLINALYNIVDRIYIGRMAVDGRLALTGVGLTFPLIMMVTAFAMLAGMGGAPLSSIARGAGDIDEAEHILGNAFTLLLLFGVALTGLGLLLRKPLLYAFGASDDTFPYADAYIFWYLLGSVFVMISMGMNPFINAQGCARTGMVTVLLGAVCNIVLDPILIFGLGMGVRGAAIATVISQGVSACWALLFLCGRRAVLRLRPRHMRLDARIVRRTCALGLSSFTMSLTESAVQIACNSTLQLYGGDLYVGVMTVIHSAKQILMMPLSGFAQGAQPVIGFNYGAKAYGRVRQGVKFLIGICITYALIAWGIAEAMPTLLIRVFNNDASLLTAGIPAFRIYFALQFMMSFQLSAQNSFVALGKAKQATFFSLLRKAFIVAPLALLLPRIGFGVHGVFWAEPISDLIGGVACFTTFMLTVWPTLRDPAPPARLPADPADVRTHTP